jgi:cytochrome c oxidase subunit 2
LAETETNPLRRPLPDGIVPEDEVTRTEDRWIVIVLGILGVMMAVIVVTGVTNALHPPSNVETIDPITLHLGGEFAESSLGTAAEPDGSVTVRLIAQQYNFVPECVWVPADTAVKFRLTSADVIHGFLLPDQREHDGGPRLRRRGPHALQRPAIIGCHAMSFVASVITECGCTSMSCPKGGSPS